MYSGVKGLINVGNVESTARKDQAKRLKDTHTPESNLIYLLVHFVNGFAGGVFSFKCHKRETSWSASFSVGDNVNCKRNSTKKRHSTSQHWRAWKGTANAAHSISCNRQTEQHESNHLHVYCCWQSCKSSTWAKLVCAAKLQLLRNSKEGSVRHKPIAMMTVPKPQFPMSAISPNFVVYARERCMGAQIEKYRTTEWMCLKTASRRTWYLVGKILPVERSPQYYLMWNYLSCWPINEH